MVDRMTAKRFIIKNERTVCDSFYGKCFVYSWKSDAEEMCELLNEQHETIQRLKQNIYELLSVDIEEELQKENEQLKQQLKDYEYRITDKEVEWLRENTVWEQMPTSKPTVTKKVERMTAKRFEIVKSKLIKDGWVISDKIKQFTFPTLKGDKRALISYCKALNELHEENERLKKENNKLHQKIFEMKTNIALERTEISRQTYTGKKNEKEYLNTKEFLDEIEKW